jgi:hypothetical protein
MLTYSCSLLNDTVNYTAQNDWTILKKLIANNAEGSGRCQFKALSWHLDEELRGNHKKILIQYGRCTELNVNRTPPEYKSEDLPLEPSLLIV